MLGITLLRPNHRWITVFNFWFSIKDHLMKYVWSVFPTWNSCTERVTEYRELHCLVITSVRITGRMLHYICMQVLLTCILFHLFSCFIITGDSGRLLYSIDINILLHLFSHLFIQENIIIGDALSQAIQKVVCIQLILPYYCISFPASSYRKTSLSGMRYYRRFGKASTNWSRCSSIIHPSPRKCFPTNGPITEQRYKCWWF